MTTNCGCGSPIPTPKGLQLRLIVSDLFKEAIYLGVGVALLPPSIAQPQYTQSNRHNDNSVLPIGLKCYREDRDWGREGGEDREWGREGGEGEGGREERGGEGEGGRRRKIGEEEGGRQGYNYIMKTFPPSHPLTGWWSK